VLLFLLLFLVVAELVVVLLLTATGAVRAPAGHAAALTHGLQVHGLRLLGLDGVLTEAKQGLAALASQVAGLRSGSIPITMALNRGMSTSHQLPRSAAWSACGSCSRQQPLREQAHPSEKALDHRAVSALVLQMNLYINVLQMNLYTNSFRVTHKGLAEFSVCARMRN